MGRSPCLRGNLFRNDCGRRRAVRTSPFPCTLCIPYTSKFPPSSLDTVLERRVILFGILFFGIRRILVIPRGIGPAVGTFGCDEDAAVDPKGDEADVEDEGEDQDGADPSTGAEEWRCGRDGAPLSTVVAQLNVFVERSDEGHEERDHEQSGRVDFGAICLCSCVSAFRRV